MAQPTVCGLTDDTKAGTQKGQGEAEIIGNTRLFPLAGPVSHKKEEREDILSAPIPVAEVVLECSRDGATNDVRADG